MITDWARQIARPVLARLARRLRSMGVTANGLTLLGGSLHGVAGLALALGQLRTGGLILALAATCDALDGAVARAGEGATPFGAFLDSTVDRVSEILVFAGLLWHLSAWPPLTNCRWCALAPLLVLLALAGSLLVSYTRARSEGIGCPTKAGLFGRLERMVVLVVALLANAVVAGLVIIAVGAWLTAGLRVLDVRRQCR